MKWPLVSIFAFEMERKAREMEQVEISRLRDHIAAERVRYDALLEKYTSLKMAGAVEVPQPTGVHTDHPQIPASMIRQPDEMRELIDQQCGSNYRKRAGMLRQLAADRANGVDDDNIRDAILNGVPSEGVPA